MRPVPKITFLGETDGAKTIVFADGSRIGWVRKLKSSRWAALDTFMIAAGSHLTRQAAVKRLLIRYRAGVRA